ncbi:hypothetical protein BJV82DRAFT_524025 [Fennellomyces sp. T-0311]|nr:hypothetical protein BJV82DRAFT_524025 [Fennellomyces sp. T-0311]
MDKPDQDTLTHPPLYRQAMNSPPANSSENQPKKTKKEEWIPPPQPTSDSEEHWDCYPRLARSIENQGTPEQVEQLHQIQQAHSPKQ